MSGIKYHGEVFDEGRRFLIIESEAAGLGSIVTIKHKIGGALVEFAISRNQAREIARHLSAAAEAGELRADQ